MFWSTFWSLSLACTTDCIDRCALFDWALLTILFSKSLMPPTRGTHTANDHRLLLETPTTRPPAAECTPCRVRDAAARPVYVGMSNKNATQKPYTSMHLVFPRQLRRNMQRPTVAWCMAAKAHASIVGHVGQVYVRTRRTACAPTVYRSWCRCFHLKKYLGASS